MMLHGWGRVWHIIPMPLSTVASATKNIAILCLNKPRQQETIIMGTCGCGYTTDANKNCNGTHRVVQAVKADIVKDLESNGFAEASSFVKGEKADK